MKGERWEVRGETGRGRSGSFYDNFCFSIIFANVTL